MYVMEILNDDCWREVFDFLDLQDQVSALQVCKQFRRVTQWKWRCQYKTLKLSLVEVELDETQFKNLITNVCATVEVLHLKFLTASKFETLKLCQFPRTHDFRFSQLRPFTLKDADICNISQIFPNLCTFSPHGDFSGEYMCRIKKLEHLTLRYCGKLNLEHLRDILTTLQLKSISLDIFLKEVGPLQDAFTNFCKLECIALNSQELTWLLSREYMCTTHLKQLVITDRLDYQHLVIFYWLLQTYKAKEVLMMEINNVQIEPDIMGLASYTNLRKIIFINHIWIWQLGAYMESLPALREMVFSNGSVNRESAILELLRASPQVEYISVECCTFDFMHFNLKVSYVMERRKKALTFNYHRNINSLDTLTEEPSYVSLKLCGYHDLLHLTDAKTQSISYEPITCTFQ